MIAAHIVRSRCELRSTKCRDEVINKYHPGTCCEYVHVLTYNHGISRYCQSQHGSTDTYSESLHRMGINKTKFHLLLHDLNSGTYQNCSDIFVNSGTYHYGIQSKSPIQKLPFAKRPMIKGPYLLEIN